MSPQLPPEGISQSAWDEASAIIKAANEATVSRGHPAAIAGRVQRMLLAEGIARALEAKQSTIPYQGTVK